MGRVAALLGAEPGPRCNGAWPVSAGCWRWWQWRCAPSGWRSGWPGPAGRADGDRRAARCPAARLHIIDGGGHMLLSRLEHIMDGITPRGGDQVTLSGGTRCCV
jgi:hypothetical protein